MQYRLRIDYVTSVNDPTCQSYDFITGMRDPIVESRYERPTIAADRHSLSIALGHPGGAGACNWRPSVIFLCVGPRGAADDAEACRALFFLAKDAGPPPEAVSLICEPKTWICADPQGREPARQASGFSQPIAVDFSVGPLPPPAKP
jgi:hypothetical protein